MTRLSSEPQVPVAGSPAGVVLFLPKVIASVTGAPGIRGIASGQAS